MIYILRSERFVSDEVNRIVRSELSEKIRLYLCEQFKQSYGFEVLYVLSMIHKRAIEQYSSNDQDDRRNFIKYFAMSILGNMKRELSFVGTHPHFSAVKGKMMSFIKLFFNNSVKIEEFDLLRVIQSGNEPTVMINKDLYWRDVKMMENKFDAIIDHIKEDVSDFVSYFMSQYIDRFVLGDYTLLKHNDIFSTIDELQNYYHREKWRCCEQFGKNNSKNFGLVEITAYSSEDIDKILPQSFTSTAAMSLLHFIGNEDSRSIFWLFALIGVLGNYEVQQKKLSNKMKTYWDHRMLSNVLKSMLYVTIKGGGVDDLIVIDSNMNKHFFRMSGDSVVIKNNDTDDVLESDIIKIKYSGDIELFNTEVKYYFPHIFTNGGKMYPLCTIKLPGNRKDDAICAG